MAASDLPFLRESAAGHVNTAVSVLVGLTPDALRTDEHRRIAGALASNRNAPSDLLARLCALLDATMLDGSRREHFVFRDLALHLLQHPNCPADAALAVINRSGRALRLEYAESTTSQVLLARLSDDASSSVAAAAQAKVGEHGA